MTKLLTISDLSKKLNLTNLDSKKPLNYVLRYWEKEFKQIKPKIIRNRRYYNNQQVELIELIHFLLKIKGLTLKGVKKILDSNVNKLDDYKSDSLKAQYYKLKIKNKLKKLLEKINRIKNYGKKNSY